MRFKYVGSSGPGGDSTNVIVGMGLRQRSNSGVNTHPLYQAFVVTNTVLLGKRSEFSASFNTNYATYTLPATLGGTNVYTINLSATEVGTNSFGEIVQVQLSLFENDNVVVELDFTDTPTSSVANSLGASRAEGHVSLLGGSVTNNNIFYGIDVLEYAVLSDPDIETLRMGPIHTSMAVGMTNRVLISRGGGLAAAVTVDLVSSDPSVVAVPDDVELASGGMGNEFLVTGQGLGTAVITASSGGYPDETTTLAVYDVACDSSSYAQLAVAFTNGGNSGLGFQPWLLYTNNGPGAGFTNVASAVLMNSRSAGVSVNENEFRSFALIAYSAGGGAPLSEAVRPFDAELAVGQAVSVHIGIAFRNGYRGVALRDNGTPLFEVYAGYSASITNDAYMYKIGTNESVNLPWSYNVNTRIKVDVKRVADELYDITLVRGGGLVTNQSLGLVNLGPVPPDEFRFYCYDAIIGSQSYFYFDQLARYTGYTLDAPAGLSIQGRDGAVEGVTNVFTVTRSGATDEALTVNLVSDDEAVATVPASVEIGIGASNATFDVVAVSSGQTMISASGLDVTGTTFAVDVVDIAYDDTSYYPPAVFGSGGNGGQGFSSWAIAVNDGPGVGFTNYVGIGMGDSASANGDVNSSAGTAFFLYANGDGVDADAPLAQASRDFTALAVGESVSVDLGVNYRNGAKGVMFQAGDTWMFEFAVFGDAYHYNVRDLGADAPVDLGWSYASDSAISVVLSRVGTTSYNVSFVRAGGAVTQTLVQAISLSQAPDRMRFYVYDTDGGGDENNLFVNRLTRFTGIVGDASQETDGIPNSWWDRYSITVSNRVASGDLDADDADNHGEFIADTDPTDPASKFPNLVNTLAGNRTMTLQTGPTTNSRVYDVWWTTNLMANPQVWTRYGLSVAGNGGSVSLSVTNDAPARVYRTGVALPE